MCIAMRRDPTDPQFIGPLQVADGEELFLGIFMSCSAILLSDYICDSLKPGERTQDAYLVDWGCWACNFVACVFVWLAYGASRLSANALTSNLLILKFVSSFCGSISCFSAAVSHISVRLLTSLLTWVSRTDCRLWCSDCGTLDSTAPRRGTSVCTC